MRIASLHSYPVKGSHRLDHDEAHVDPWGLAGDRRWMVVDPDGVGITQRQTARLVGLRPLPRPGGLLLQADGRPDLFVAEPTGMTDCTERSEGQKGMPTEGSDGQKDDVRVFSSTPLVPARLAGDDAHAWVTALLGRPARLAWMADTDGRPVDPDYAGADDRVSFADGFPLLVANTASLAALNDRLQEAGDEPVPMTRFRPNVVVDGAAPWAEDDWIGGRMRFGDVVMRAPKSCARCIVTTIDQETGEKHRQPLHALGQHRRYAEGLLFAVNLIPDTPGIIRVGESIELLP